MAERPPRRSHDAAWKQFFALSVVVDHLLRGFFPEVAALLDFTTLADISGEWVHDGARRRADSVWRVRNRDGSERSLVLFLEFQSTVDVDMARRVLRNMGMAAERLRRSRALDPDGRLRALCGERGAMFSMLYVHDNMLADRVVVPLGFRSRPVLLGSGHCAS